MHRDRRATMNRSPRPPDAATCSSTRQNPPAASRLRCGACRTSSLACA